MRAAIEIVEVKGKHKTFELGLSYPQPVQEEHKPLLGLAMTMPVLNYGLFTDEIHLEYDMARADLSLVEDLLFVFSRDIFINKLVRRRADYILHRFLPAEEDINEKNAGPRASVMPRKVTNDRPLNSSPLKGNSAGVLSSGGKESLLTYCMLKELKAEVHPFYINESGGHWRTALTAYRFHSKNEPNCARVWTNVDRFYNFMLENMRIIRRDFRKVWADTYPIRLCIFPFYIFALLPLFAEQRIGNLLLGSEFDDPRVVPVYNGIRHHFGVYDQTQEYDLRMEAWYNKRLPGLRQWSAVRPISGLIVERILCKRYPQVARLQRSCHSCHFEGGAIVPCGKCSKCLGIMLFLLANNINPALLGFRKTDISSFPERLKAGNLRLDKEEKEHAQGLAFKKERVAGCSHPHIESIHIHPETADLNLVPARFRKGLLKILENYTSDYTVLHDDKWEPALPSSRP